MKMSSESLPVTEIERSIHSFFAEARALVERRLEELIPPSSVSPSTLHEAIRWSLLGGGKRLRPALVIAAGRTFGTPDDRLIATACAFEMIHTYSLIHDDLPSMDNDDLRRGRPTSHVKFDEATAILAGDALQAMAFQVVSEDGQLTADLRIGLVGELARASGTPSGMVAGQALDLAAELREVTADELQNIHAKKTGALITAAVRCGAMIAGATGPDLNGVTEYATHLGLLFQITDDLLDISATSEELGKTPGKDAHAQKATYPGLYGQKRAAELARETCNSAIRALRQVDCDTTLLEGIAGVTLSRQK